MYVLDNFVAISLYLAFKSNGTTMSSDNVFATLFVIKSRCIMSWRDGERCFFSSHLRRWSSPQNFVCFDFSWSSCSLASIKWANWWHWTFTLYVTHPLHQNTCRALSFRLSKSIKMTSGLSCYCYSSLAFGCASIFSVSLSLSTSQINSTFLCFLQQSNFHWEVAFFTNLPACPPCAMRDLNSF